MKALLYPLAVGLAVGAAAAWTLRLADIFAAASRGAGAAMGAALFVVAFAGLVMGSRAASRVAPTSPSDAAWALDRLAHARGRGLVAATVEGPAAAEAAWAGPAIVPPATRLKAPEGLVAVLAAALLAATPFVAAHESRRAHARRNEGSDVATAAGANEAGRLEAEAAAAAREARTARRVREALGIPAGTTVDAADLAEKLARPETLAAAKAAAPEGSEAAAALGEKGVASASALARTLALGAAEKADALYRSAAAVRAGSGSAYIPPTKRALVARYLSARLAAQENSR